MIFSPKRSLLSFEFFPPDRNEKLLELVHTGEQLNHFNPNFFSVTFGAGGNSQTRTMQTVANLASKQFSVCPHLSAIDMTAEKIQSLLDYYKTLAINNLIIIRGDEPPENSKPFAKRIFNYAEDLVKFVRETTGNTFQLHVAAYPEFHPEALSVKADLHYFQQKIIAGATSAITQYFFNSDAYFRFVECAHKQGIYTPIIPGIMPIMNYIQLKKFSKQCGAEIPLWIRKRCNDFIENLDEAGLKQFGIEVIVNLCETLLKGGAPGLHFYTLNRLEPTYSIVKQLGIKSSAEIVIKVSESELV